MVALGLDSSVSPGTTAYHDQSSLHSAMPAQLVMAHGGFGGSTYPSLLSDLCLGTWFTGFRIFQSASQGAKVSLHCGFSDRLIPTRLSQKAKKAWLAGQRQPLLVANYYLGASC